MLDKLLILTGDVAETASRTPLTNLEIILIAGVALIGVGIFGYLFAKFRKKGRK